SYATFNSITNDTIVGDERKFSSVLRVGEKAGQRAMFVHDGQVLVLRIFYGNSAAANLTSTATAIDARIRVALPSAPASRTWITAHVSAGNTFPPDVAATVSLIGDRPFRISY